MKRVLKERIVTDEKGYTAIEEYSEYEVDDKQAPQVKKTEAKPAVVKPEPIAA